MANNLLKAGHELTVFDLAPEAKHGLKARPPESIAAVAASKAELIITMLPAAKHVKAVYLGEEGLHGGEGCWSTAHHRPPTSRTWLPRPRTGQPHAGCPGIRTGGRRQADVHGRGEGDKVAHASGTGSHEPNFVHCGPAGGQVAKMAAGCCWASPRLALPRP